MRLIFLISAAFLSLPLLSMPTAEELEQVKPLVQDLMKSDLDAMKAGKKSRADVAKSAMSLYPQAESQAAKLLLARTAFNLYVKAGEYEAAEKSLDALLSAVPDYPAADQAELLEKALYPIPYKAASNLRARLAAIKDKAQAAGQLKSLLSGFGALAEGPKRKAAATRIASSYVSLGDWPNAVKYFALSDSPAASAAQEELKLAGEPEATRSYDKAANAWWSVELPKRDAKLSLSFRAHSAELYSKALPTLTGLAKVQASRRIKEYESEVAAAESSPSAKPTSSSLPAVGMAKYYGVELIGKTVKENRGVLSGFAMGSYAKIKAPFNPKDKPIEAVVEFEMGSNLDNFTGILTATTKHGFGPFYSIKGQLVGYLSSNGSSWNLANGLTLGCALAPQTTYRVKATWDGKVYRWYTKDKNSWNCIRSLECKEPVFGGTDVHIGMTRPLDKFFAGTVNLNCCYICIDGKLWWEGVKGAYKNANM